VIGAVHFDFAENVEILMGFPPVARSNVRDSVEEFVVLGGLLEIELIARESHDGKVISVRAVLLDQRIEVRVLLCVRAKGGDVNDEDDLTFEGGEVIELALESLHLEVVNRLIDSFAFAPSSGFVDEFGSGLVFESGPRGRDH